MIDVEGNLSFSGSHVSGTVQRAGVRALSSAIRPASCGGPTGTGATAAPSRDASVALQHCPLQVPKNVRRLRNERLHPGPEDGSVAVTEVGASE